MSMTAILNNIAGVVVILTLGLCALMFREWRRMGRELRRSCQYCHDDGDECCVAVHRDGMRCTRSLGHKGRHVACSAFRHRIVEWGGKAVKSAVAAENAGGDA